MERAIIGQFFRAAILALIVMHAAVARAEEAADPQATAGKPAVASEEMPRLVPLRDYRGDLWDRPALLGDLGGLRQKLMDNGLRFDVNFTQTVQRVVAHGTRNQWRYLGTADFGLKLDTGHAGLWPGGMLVLRGEAQFGKHSNKDTGAALPVNTDALFPFPGVDETTLSELYYVQFLAEWFGVMLGKMSPRDANVFAGNETEQFMNAAFNFNPVIGTTVPLCGLGAGGILRPTEWLMLTTLALDTEGLCDQSGFDTVFDRGTSVFQQAEFTIKPFGLPGHQRFSWTWSDKSRLQFDQSLRDVIRVILTGSLSGLKRDKSDGSFFYDFDQYLYLVPGSKDRGFGVFGRAGFTDGKVNPIKTFYSLGVSGKGLISGREKDTFGIAYYYLGLSDHLPKIVKARARDEHGGEVYYNIAVTGWLHLTPDLQIIVPARHKFKTAVVTGLRMKIDF